MVSIVALQRGDKINSYIFDNLPRPLNPYLFDYCVNTNVTSVLIKEI